MLKTTIKIIHILLILMTIIIPLLNSNYFLVLHIVILPFIFIHWIADDNTCSIVLMEKKLRELLNKENNECISAKIIEPIYDLPKIYSKISYMIYLFAILLWLLSIMSLLKKYMNNEINNYNQLFNI